MGLRIVMMGTGDFALPTLLQLYESPHDVAALVTQPDRTGRGHHDHINPLKQAALERGTPVLQPEVVNSPESLAQLQSIAADVFVVAAYGQLLTAKLLAIPRLGAINLHASLLPRFRGAAPIPYAILAGVEHTGVTIFQIEPKLDAGPILGIVDTPIGPKETAGELEARLSQLAVGLTLDVLAKLEGSSIAAIPQNKDLVSRAPRMRKSEGAIDWSRSAMDIERHVRAMQPWPSPFTYLHLPDGHRLRMLLLDVDVLEEATASSTPGTISAVDPEHGILVQTGQGLIRINQMQPSGKRAMTASAFLRGHALQVGQRFGPETTV